MLTPNDFWRINAISPRWQCHWAPSHTNELYRREIIKSSGICMRIRLIQAGCDSN